MMTIEDEYRLSLYQSLGKIEGNEKIELVRNRSNGLIGVRKEVSCGREDVYRYLRKKPSLYIPDIYEIVKSDEKLIIIEEYITGNNVEDILRERRMDEQEGAEFALELCEALKVLHHAKPMIVCRDLKAENVMIDNDGHVKIIDFDIARTVREGQGRDTVLMGTAEYAAPEQYGFFQTDNRSDIFSLGVLLNYAMTGRFLVEGIVEGKLQPIIRRCTYMEPSERYQSVEELERDIRRTVLFSESRIDKEGREFTGWMIPGFRTRKPWKMLTAVLGYVLIGWFTLTLEAEDNGQKIYGVELWTERIVLCIALALFVLLAADYRGWSRKIPVVNSGNKWIRTAGLAVLFVVLIVAAAFIYAVAGLFIG